MIRDYFYIMKSTFRRKSLNRILQEIYVQKKIANGNVIEFGADADSSFILGYWRESAICACQIYG